MKKIALPSLWESIKKRITREKCFAAILVVLTLVAIFLIVAAFHKTIAYATDSLSSNSNLESEAAQEEDNLTILINNYILDLREKGYENVSYSISNSFDAVAASGDQKLFSNDFVFYADYCVLKMNNIYYWFKTEQSANDFLEKLLKYGKQDYEKYINVKEQIEEETSEEQLEKIVLAQKVAAEERIRKNIAKKSTKYTASKTIKKAEASPLTYSGDVTGTQIAEYAVQYVGNPYVWGGTSLTNGADCSGFVYRVFNNCGIEMSRLGHASLGTWVSFDELEPGDIVFYSDTGRKITHEGIYIGNGQIVHASTPSGGIKISSVNIMVKMTARRVI